MRWGSDTSAIYCNREDDEDVKDDDEGEDDQGEHDEVYAPYSPSVITEILTGAGFGN